MRFLSYNTRRLGRRRAIGMPAASGGYAEVHFRSQAHHGYDKSKCIASLGNDPIF